MDPKYYDYTFWTDVIFQINHQAKPPFLFNLKLLILPAPK